MTAQDIIDQTNAYRASKGLKPLTIDPVLQKAAEAHAQDMVSKNYFSHLTPDGKDFTAFIPSSNVYVKTGQNLARHYPDATTTMAAWKASPDHNKNLTDTIYNSTGVAVVPGSNMVVQYFGLPKTASTSAPQAKAPAPQPIPAILKTNNPAPINFNALTMKS